MREDTGQPDEVPRGTADVPPRVEEGALLQEKGRCLPAPEGPVGLVWRPLWCAPQRTRRRSAAGSASRNGGRAEQASSTMCTYRGRTCTSSEEATCLSTPSSDGVTPVGLIAMWSGSAGSIPTGWALQPAFELAVPKRGRRHSAGDQGTQIAKPKSKVARQNS